MMYIGTAIRQLMRTFGGVRNRVTRKLKLQSFLAVISLVENMV